jgi:hypothetical protein
MQHNTRNFRYPLESRHPITLFLLPPKGSNWPILKNSELGDDKIHENFFGSQARNQEFYLRH